MKFRKLSAQSSPKMELLRRSSGGNKISNFKRSKSFRASVKIITKIRNHANLHTTPSYDLSPISFNPKTNESLQGKMQNLTSVSEDLEEKNYGSTSTSDLKEYKTVSLEDSGKIVKDLESKLSLGSNDKVESSIKGWDKSNKLSIKSDEFNAYENPSFMDSSLDKSMTGFFHQQENFYQPNEFGKSEKSKILSFKVRKDKKNQVENGLTVIVENHQICKKHRWCTRTKSNMGKNLFRVSNEPGEKSFSFKTFKGYINDGYNENKTFLAHRIMLPKTNCQEFIINGSKHFGNFSKSLTMRTGEDIANAWSDSQTEGFIMKGNRKSRKSLKELELNLATEETKHGSQLMATSGAKLHSLQGMEFLEGFGKKKQYQQLQRNHHKINNFSSIHINSLTAQPSLNIHLHALFAAVEHGNLDKARAILESTDVDVNSVNCDGLSPLDVAVLSNNRPLAKMLVAFGAQEGNQFKSPESLGSHLASLLSEAEHRVQELGGVSSGATGGKPSSTGPLLEPLSTQGHRGSFSSQHNNLTGCGGNTEDKQLALWERRARALRKMLLGFDQARPPDMPFMVIVDVTGTTSVTARFQESETQESPICTKFKIQWSIKEDFVSICGECELLDMKQKECRIDGLLQGHKYYFRAAAGNLKGYSRFKSSTPVYLTPSSWRDIDGRLARFAGRLEQLDSLLSDIRGTEYSQETPALQRRNHKKKTTIKQLFTATSKFQKNLRRGIFLACLLYHDDKVLVTNEDFLPVIEVDETYPSCIYNDFHWIMKVACSWDDVKTLKQDMEKNQNSTTNHFRIKLLQAALQMQAALCIQDLGQFYHKPIRDVQGTLVFSAVNYVTSPKLVSVLNSRWLPLSKVTKKFITHEDNNVADILMSSIQDQMAYHQVSSIKLSRGLYLGYLKMQSSVDSIQVVVTTKSPNVLPHCKIRDNPHVSADEWDHLKRMSRLQASDYGIQSEEKENATNEFQGSEQQKLFIDMIASAVKRLFNFMEIGSDESLLHRLYDAEVIDLNSDVSFLLAVPPAETACSVPGTREILLQRGDLLSLPIQLFEMIHLSTYQKEFINRYSKLSCILELDTTQAQHSHREAFSSSELSVAKDKLARLQDLQSQMNTVWKGARWLIDVITFARDRSSSLQTSGGICIKHLLSFDRNKNNVSGNSLKRSLLQLPPRDPKLVKSSPGRGSWPGPSVLDPTCCSQTNLLTTEFSKSEQQLPSGPFPRKGSSSSNCSSSSEPYRLQSQIRLPPSKSEDMLPPGSHPKTFRGSRPSSATTRSSVSASTSPLLGTPGSCKPTASVAAIADEHDESGDLGSRTTALPGILQVYAAYETGLASGTSLKLHVTGRTTAREVVDLVVKQLNVAVLLKGLEGPVYPAEQLNNFCLVAVIGARERCLRDDFKPLQLQNPWKKGRLYVRQKQDVLAALEHSSKHTAYL